MIRVSILLSIILTLIVSCSNTPESDVSEIYVDILDNEEAINASEFAKDMEIVKLEFSEKSILSDVRFLKTCEEYLYVKDNTFNGIYIFDDTGKLSQVFQKPGKGPGEYLNIDDFLIDCDNQTLEIFDRLTTRVLIYDLGNFNLKDEFKIPFEFCFTFAKNKGVYYFQTNSSRNLIENSPTNSEVVVYDPHSKSSWNLFDTQLPEKENRNLEFVDIFTENEDGELFISLAWKKNIFKVLKDTVMSYIHVDVGSAGYPETLLYAQYDDKLAFLNSDLVNGKKNFFKLLMKNSQGYLFTYAKGYPPNPVHYFYLDGGRKILHTENIINDFLPIPLENIEIFNEQQGQLLAVVYPANIKDRKILAYLEVEPNDNPLIFKFIL